MSASWDVRSNQCYSFMMPKIPPSSLQVASSRGAFLPVFYISWNTQPSGNNLVLFSSSPIAVAYLHRVDFSSTHTPALILDRASISLCKPFLSAVAVVVVVVVVECLQQNVHFLSNCTELILFSSVTGYARQANGRSS